MSHPTIIIETLSADKMRYQTLGDWFFDGDGNLRIQVAAREILPNVDATVFSPEVFLVALHEWVEFMLCKKDGVDQEAVDAFDFAFKGGGEPGDAHDAPYRQQHRRAMIAEHLLADWLGVTGYGKIE